MLEKLKNARNRLRKLYCRTSSEKWIQYLREQGMKIGEGTVIFSNPAFVLLDLTRPWMIEIGKNVQITRDVKILTHDYSYSTAKAYYGAVTGSCGKVSIGDNCFIGVGAIILKGTTIGDNVIVGAGSVVSGGSFPSNSVIAGNPAKVICSLEDYYKKRQDLQLQEAKDLVLQYFKVYNRMPEENLLDEFFWLFTPRNNAGVKKYKYRLELMNNYNVSLHEFMRSKPRFESYDAFIKWCENQQ